MFAMPLMSSYAISKAPQIYMGQYMALYSMSWSLAQIMAPVIGSNVIHYWSYNSLWLLTSLIALTAFAGFRWLSASNKI